MTQLNMIATLALRSAIEEMVPSYGSDTGVTVHSHYGASKELLGQICAGMAADVALLTDAAIKSLEDDGVFVAGKKVDLVRSDIGIAVKQGEPLPAINTVEEFKQTLLNAKSLAYSDVGASGIYFKELLQDLGIAQEVNAKARILPPGFTGEPVASGAIEIAVQQISELIQVPGLTIVGKLPPPIQQSTVFSVGIFAHSPVLALADALIHYLGSSRMDAVYRRHGLEPVCASRNGR